MCILSSRSDWIYNCTNCHDAVLCTNSRVVLGSLHIHSHCSSFCSACVMELGSTCTCTYQAVLMTPDCQYSIYSCLVSAGIANTAPWSCICTLTQSHTHTLPHNAYHWYLLLWFNQRNSRQRFLLLILDSLSHKDLCLLLWSNQRNSRQRFLLLILDSLSHTRTCACCCGLTKGTQDRDFSYSFSDSLSHILSLMHTFSILSHAHTNTAQHTHAKRKTQPKENMRWHALMLAVPKSPAVQT